MQSIDDSTPQLPRKTLVLIQLALAMGSFAIGIGEFAIMGLRPYIATNLNIGELEVGHAISSYALGVVVGAPLLAIWGARLNRRTLLILLMLFYTIGNGASAFANDYFQLILSRFIAGLPHGAYFGVAALLIASLVPYSQRARAVSHVLLGLTVAILIGNPLANWLGQVVSWRVAFALVGGCAALTVFLITLLVPAATGVSKDKTSPLDELKEFNRLPVWMTLIIGMIGFAGLFCTLSYLSDTMLNITQVNGYWIVPGLVLFGAGTIGGNVLGGRMFDRIGFDAVGVLLFMSALILFAFPFMAHNLALILLASFMLGLIISVCPSLQTHLMDVAGKAQTLAAASNHSALNLANAIGPLMGGVFVSRGVASNDTGFIGCVTTLIGLALFFVARRQLRLSRS